MVVGKRSDASPGITSNPEVAALPTGVSVGSEVMERLGGTDDPEVAALPTGVSVGSGVTERLGGTDDPVATTFVFCEPC